MEHELSIRSFEAGDQEQARWLILEGLGEPFGSIDETCNPDVDDILHHYVRAGHVFMVGCMGREIVGTGALIRRLSIQLGEIGRKKQVLESLTNSRHTDLRHGLLNEDDITNVKQRIG